MSDSGNWKSRKALITVSSLVVSWATATAAWLWMGKMNSGEWLSFNQWVLPALSAIYAGANVMEKKKA